MTTEKRLLGVNPVASGDGAEGVSFEYGDYLSRGSDLTGNSDGKTFTFSCFVYGSGSHNDLDHFYRVQGSGLRFGIEYDNSNKRIEIRGVNSEGTTMFRGYSGSLTMPVDTWNHVLFSSSGTQNVNDQKLYINDTLVSMTWPEQYGGNIDFTGTDHWIGESMTCRLAHLFLDYTYRNLSTESNRRLFIDSDGKPASGQADLSPILYLPMTDADTAGDNAGTGGDFTVNGVLATAERGPNQYNCSASEFNGSNDYLSRSSISDSTDSTTAIISFSYKRDMSSNRYIFTSNNGTGNNTAYYYNAGQQIIIQLGSFAAKAVEVRIPAGALGAVHHITVSVDTSVTEWDGSTDIRYLGRKVVVDGKVLADSDVMWQTWNKDNVITTNNDIFNHCIGIYNETSNNSWDGALGELYFDTTDSYIDLSTDNPFWDSDANRPKPVAQVIEETGTTPLIAMPLRADDAGNNLGTGGDFTVNSGPFTGARGGSEYWARSADFDAGADWLYRGGLSGAANSKFYTLVVAYRINTFHAGRDIPIALLYANGQEMLKVSIEPTAIGCMVRTLPNTTILNMHSNSATTTLGQWHVLMMCGDTSNSGNNHIFLDGVAQTLTTNTSTNTNIPYTTIADTYIGNDYTSANNTTDGNFSVCYFSNTYTDFSQESNRNKFVDQLGYPRDLTQQIEDGDIPTPLTYMKFDDLDDLGANSGTGGDFSIYGTVTAGSDVNL